MTGRNTDSIPNTELTPRQVRAIPLLVSPRTQKEGIKLAGISRQTLHRWMKDPVFQCELRRHRDLATGYALDRVTVTMIRAVETLEGLLDSECEPVRRASAGDLLRFALRTMELRQFEDRLTQLEEVIGQQEQY
jgi:hypothetical protein